MDASAPAPDFITIDGGEGGTGAGPLVFTDHVALPLPRARTASTGLRRHGRRRRRVRRVAACSACPPALLAFALGCDMVNVGREAMLAVGCIQAQRCHTGRCPTGVTTHSPLAAARPRPGAASVRLANYVIGLRSELLRLARTCGVPHPALVALDQLELMEGPGRCRPPSASATATAGGFPRTPTSWPSSRSWSSSPRPGPRRLSASRATGPGGTVRPALALVPS